MSQENVDLVLQMHTAVMEGDLEALLAGVHPNAEYRAATQQAIEGEGSVFRGHDGLRRWFSSCTICTRISTPRSSKSTT